MISDIDIAYDAYATQVDHNLYTTGPSEDLQTALQAGSSDDVMSAVRQMARDACAKAKLLWTGSPEGTILRNHRTGISATRITNSAGLPLWEFSGLGSPTFSTEPVLLPEDEWKCVYDPTAEI
ncbi:hypothetical protein [Mycolicibacterium palauense]|uniref:hypothetical protein n=1 Tax=Mycolicibacterium palauense TaxID=2034511 RepID=UPI000BFEF9DF|nr:hypothetical protein [Mycolicibacterium palauense]